MVFSPVSRLTSTSEQAAPKVVYLSGFELLAPVQHAQSVNSIHCLNNRATCRLSLLPPTSNRLTPVSEDLFSFTEALDTLQILLPISMQPNPVSNSMCNALTRVNFQALLAMVHRHANYGQNFTCWLLEYKFMIQTSRWKCIVCSTDMA